MVINIVFGAVHPLAKLSALFERCIAFAKKCQLGKADPAQGLTHRWPGALAHTHRGHIGRFHQSHLYAVLTVRAVFRRNNTSGQPTGAAATKDQYVSTVFILNILDRKSTRLNSSHVANSYA